MSTSGNFTQYQSPWGKKKYSKGATYSVGGCFPTGAANIIYSWDKKITPLKVGTWIRSQGGVTNGGATYLSIVIPTFKHFGGEAKEYKKAFDLFKKLYADKQNGFDSYGILDVKGGRSGVTWTAGGGHFIVIRDIKKNGSNDFMLYIQDSGKRGNTGWYSYRKHLSGCIKYAYYVTSSKLNAGKSEAPKEQKKTTSVAEKKKTNEEIAQEVLANKWGSGDERKERLTKAGYDYKAVQQIVNKIVERNKTSKAWNKTKIAHATSSGKQGCKTGTGYKASGNRAWKYVMRAKDPAVAEKIAEAAKIATTKKNIQYAQDHAYHSNNLAKALSKHGFDMTKVTEVCYTVCTDFQMCCVLCADADVRKGIKDYGKWAWAGYNRVQERLLATGKFEKLTDKDMLKNGAGLKAGDLVVSEPHGVIIISV